VLQQRAERLAPHARRHFEVLRERHRGVRRRQRRADRRGAELTHELLRHRILEVVHRTRHLLGAGVAGQGQRGADEDQSRDPLGVFGRDQSRGQRARRVPHQNRPLHAQSIEEGDGVRGVVGGGVPSGRLVGVAVAPLRDGERPGAGRQAIENWLADPPRVGDARQEDHRGAARGVDPRSLLHDIESGAAGDPHAAVQPVRHHPTPSKRPEARAHRRSSTIGRRRHGCETRRDGGCTRASDRRRVDPYQPGGSVADDVTDLPRKDGSARNHPPASSEAGTPR